MAVRELVAEIKVPTKNVDHVEKINVQALETIRDVLETMEHHNMEYISGPDIGVNSRLLVLDATQQNFGIIIMINPTIVYDVENKVVVEYNDIFGHNQTVILVDKLAECFRFAMEEIGE